MSSPDKWIIYVISLAKCPERIQSFTSHLKSQDLTFEIVQAIDGDLLDEHLTTANKKAYFTPLNKYEIAAALSHKKALQQFCNSNKDFALILEDDAVPIYNIDAVMSTLLQNLTEQDPILIKLYAKRLPVLKQQITSFTLNNTKFTIYRPIVPSLGAVATLYSRQSALNLLPNLRTIDAPFDVILQKTWKTGLTVLQINPPLFLENSKQLGGSTIQKLKPRTFPEKLKREVKRFVYRLKLNTRLIREELRSRP